MYAFIQVLYQSVFSKYFLLSFFNVTFAEQSLLNKSNIALDHALLYDFSSSPNISLLRFVR